MDVCVCMSELCEAELIPYIFCLFYAVEAHAYTVSTMLWSFEGDKETGDLGGNLREGTMLRK